MTRAELGREYFKSGCNCAQSVAMAFSDLLPLSEELIMKAMLPFGSGVGRMRLLCGAINGMCFVLGLLYSKTDPETGKQNKDEIYKKVQLLAGQFREKNGTIICRELLSGISNSTEPTSEERSSAYYKKRPCDEYVYEAVELLEAFIDSNDFREISDEL